MKMAVASSWIYPAILMGALMHSSSGCTASESSNRPVQGLCFEHIGPQDKPMPGFCVSAPGTAPGAAGSAVDSGNGQAIQPAPERWRAVLELVDRHGQKGLGRAAVFGDYQVRSIPAGRLLHLPAGAMRKIVAALEGDSGLNQAQVEKLQRLRLRFRVPEV